MTSLPADLARTAHHFGAWLFDSRPSRRIPGRRILGRKWLPIVLATWLITGRLPHHWAGDQAFVHGQAERMPRGRLARR